MEFRHFSHNHGLVFHQVPPQGSKINCSGCKSPATGHIYACWQCRYFLHDRCFRAARSLQHPSHPLHPLNLLPFPTYPSGSFLCNSCKLPGDGFSYTCSACEFDIHVHCALTNLNSQSQIPIYPPHSGGQIPNFTTNPPPLSGQTSEPPTIIKHFSHPHDLKPTQIYQKNGKLCSACEWEFSPGTVYCCTESSCNFILDKACFDCPREVRHKSHPQHPLTLLSAPPNGRKFDCYACYRSGKAYVYTCPTCSYSIHIDCVDWRETMIRPDHVHPLALYFSPEEATGRGVSFTCSACDKSVNEKAWVYYCRQCGFGFHTSCVGNPVKQ